MPAPKTKKLVHILFNFQDGPWGGGNQFLKALRDEFIKKKIYSNKPKDADVILFNSHHDLTKVLLLKLKYSKKIFIHRIDGPIFFIRDKNIEIDKLIFKFSKKIASLSIFQSQWSFKKCLELGFDESAHAIIYNAPNKSIFNKDNLSSQKSRKVRLIATSWSDNNNKGFDIYKYLDAHLNFEKYTFMFIGNTPIEFKNIKHLMPLSTTALAEKLKKSDIFITASKNDPCSNSLIEALSCGLPAVVRNDGGHPELIKKGGETFNGHEDVIRNIEKVVNNYSFYQYNIPEYDITKIAEDYLTNFDLAINNSKPITSLTFLTLYVQTKLTKLISILK